MTARQPRRRSTSFELAGMTSDTGRLGRRVDTSGVVIPDRERLRLDEDARRLLYDTRSPMLTDEQRPELLDAFLCLRTATAADVLRFARTYGVLSLRAIREPGVYTEDIATWHEFSNRAHATLSVASRIHQETETNPRDWESLAPWWWNGWNNIHREIRDARERSRRVERLQLEDVMNAWLRLAEIRPSFSWPKGIVFTNLAGVDEGNLTMIGVVALQLVLSVKGARAIATCDGCGNTYTRRSRRAPTGRNNYCSNCGLKAAWRDAQARRRSKAALAEGHRQRETRTKIGRLRR